MANLALNAFSCLADSSNTGFTSCFYTPGLLEATILTPHGHEFTPSEVSDMLTTLQDGLAKDAKADRFQMIKTFVGMEDKSSEAVYETTGYGGQRKIRNGKYIWQFEYIKGGGCLHKKISSLDNKQDLFDVIFVDTENNCLLGVTTEDGKFRGFTMELLDVPNFKINTGGSDTKFYVQFALQDPKEMNLNFGIVSFDKSVSLLTELDSLIDTELSVQTAMNSTGVAKIKVYDSCGGTNLTDTYSTELATSSLWTLTRKSSGAGITISSVSFDSALKCITIDADHTDGDYLAGADAILTLGDVSDLVGAGILGHANASITITLG